MTASPLVYPLSFFPSVSTTTAVHPAPAITFPAVLRCTRTSERNSFTREEAMSPHSDDTPQKRDQPRLGVNPDLTTTPATMAILTPAPRTGEQDGEWKNWSAAIMMNRDDLCLFFFFKYDPLPFKRTSLIPQEQKRTRLRSPRLTLTSREMTPTISPHVVYPTPTAHPRSPAHILPAQRRNAGGTDHGGCSLPTMSNSCTTTRPM